LGNSLRKLGRLEDAVNAYKRAVAINPSIGHRGNLGATLREVGRLDEAEEVFRGAVRADSQDQDFRDDAGLALTLSDLGKDADAESVFREALKHHKDVPELHQLFGDLLAKQQRWDDAKSECLAVLELKPDDQWALVMLSAVYLGEGDSETATRYFNRF